MPTEQRIQRIRNLLDHRFSDLRIVLEEVKNTHNASAVVRTCDAAGIHYLDVISAENTGFPINEAISTRAEKWLQLNYYQSIEECLNTLKKKGFIVAATHLGENAVSYTDFDFTRPTALVFGNEAEGISSEALALSDICLKIPMAGMVQSLNLSVSVSVILYECLRQRAESSRYKKKGLPDSLKRKLENKWLK